MKTRWIPLLVLALGAAVPLLQDAPAAVVVKVQGAVSIRAAAGGQQPAAVGAKLSAGDQVIPEAGAQAVVVHSTGRTEVVTQTLTIAAPTGATEGDMFTRTVRVLAQAATSDARRTGNRQGMIRPLPGGPAPISPRNNVALKDTRPSFAWFSVPGASGYRLQIRAEGQAPQRFDAGKDTVFQLPETTELERGKPYFWTVAPMGGRPVKEETFVVLGPEQLREREGALASIREMGLDPEGDGELLAAVVFTDLGLLYDAHTTLASLEAEGGLSADALLLKGEGLDGLGHYDAARTAFDRADEMLR